MAARYTRELLEEAARRALHIDDTVRLCGGQPTPGSRRYLRRKMAEAGLPVHRLATDRVRHTEERLRAAVRASASVSEVVRRLGVSQVGGNHAHIGRRIAALGIDTSHFTGGRPGRRTSRQDGPLCLTDPARGRIPGRRLRKALLDAGAQERCVMCGVGPVWRGRPLTLEVDHVNGQWWDNRPGNPRLLCPNCHAVTDTFRGRARAAR
jgi:hypothetical protein